MIPASSLGVASDPPGHPPRRVVVFVAYNPAGPHAVFTSEAAALRFAASLDLVDVSCVVRPLYLHTED